MQAWKKAPLLRIAFPFVMGIICAMNFTYIDAGFALLISGFFLLAFLLNHQLFHKAGYQYRWLPGVLATIAIFFAGYTLTLGRELNQRPDFFAKNVYKSEFIQYRLSEPIQEKEKTYKCIAEAQSLIYKKGTDSTHWVRENVSGKVMLYFAKSPKTAALKYGDIILGTSIPAAPFAPRNPGEFDMRSYLALKNIYHTCYLKDEDLILTGKNSANSLWKLMFSTREKWSRYFEENIPGADEQAIAKALVLGDESTISQEVINDYAASGTLHILSVSGLHIGVIFYMLNLLLGFLKKSRAGRISRTLIILFLLWGYAFLTGLSPAVCRSVAMFSFVIIGTDLRRISSIYNSIAASVLVLLVIYPFMLAQEGFQLSYIALIGIVLLQPYIYKWWQPAENVPSKHLSFFQKYSQRFLRFLWGMTSVSLAAQLAVFPIGLLYFNRFPIYFLVTNLLVIPLSSIILIAGCIFLLIHICNLSFLYAIGGKIIYGSIHFMNWFVRVEHGMPYSQTNGIYISTGECLLIYLVILTFCLAFIFKYKNQLKIALVACMCFIAERAVSKTITFPKNELIVHSINRNLAITVKEQNKLFLIGDSSMINDKNKIAYYIKKYSYMNFITDKNLIVLNMDSNYSLRNNISCLMPHLIQFGKKRIIIFDRKTSLKKMDSNTVMDVIILHDNPKIHIDELIHKMQVKRVIINATNSAVNTEKWENECIQNFIPYTILQKDNSFVLN